MSSCNHLIECADSCCFPVLYSSHTPENTAPPGILIAPCVVLFSFLVLISTYVLVSSCSSTIPVGMQYFYMKKLQPYTIAAAHMNRAAKYTAPALHHSAEPGCGYLHSYPLSRRCNRSASDCQPPLQLLPTPAGQQGFQKRALHPSSLVQEHPQSYPLITSYQS